MRTRAMAMVLVVSGLLAACGVEKPYEPLEGPTTSVEVLAGDRTTVSCPDLRPFTWKVAPVDRVAVDAIRADDVPPVPGTDETGARTSSIDFQTADVFLGQASAPDEEDRRAVMASAGFQTGVFADFADAPIPFKVQALRFRDPAAAVAYAAQHMTAVCPEAGGTVTRLSEDGGIVYLDSLETGVAIFVLGDEEITLIVPGEIEGDKVELLQQWHRAWLDERATGPAVTVT